MAKHRLLNVFGEVVPQVPAIRDLSGLGRAAAGAVGVADRRGPQAAAFRDRPHLIVRSYVATARKHGINPLGALRQLLAGDPWLPTPAHP